MAELFDKRSDFFRRYFELGLPWEKYIASGTPSQSERWNRGLSQLTLSTTQKNLLSSFVRKMNIIVLSGIWCGDCSRQGPLFRLIEQNSACMEFRYVESRANPELVDELRIQGGTRVPVVVTVSEDFWEISRFGERTLSAYRRKARQEFGAACDSGVGVLPEDEYGLELSDWVEHFERLQLILRTSPFLRERYSD